MHWFACTLVASLIQSECLQVDCFEITISCAQSVHRNFRIFSFFSGSANLKLTSDLTLDFIFRSEKGSFVYTGRFNWKIDFWTGFDCYAEVEVAVWSILWTYTEFIQNDDWCVEDERMVLEMVRHTVTANLFWSSVRLFKPPRWVYEVEWNTKFCLESGPETHLQVFALENLPEGL